MSMNDPLSDMIARIKNAATRKRASRDVANSIFKS